MLAEPAIDRRSGCTPGQWLVDGGYPAHAQIDRVEALTQGRIEVIAPVPEPRHKADMRRDDDDQNPPPAPHPRKDSDSGAVAQWRARMATPAARELYKQRAATAECVSAQARNRGLQRLPVRGLLKVRALACLYALAHNLMRMLHIAPQMLGRGSGACAATRAAT